MTRGGLKLVLEGGEYVELGGPGGQTTPDAIADLVSQRVFPTSTGSGSPEGVVTGSVGNTYVDTTAHTLYYKETGTGNTGWVLIGSGGGGGSFPDFTGSGSPEGVQTANVGQSYIDSASGGLYFFNGVDATNIGWGLVGGIGEGTVPGVREGYGVYTRVLGPVAQGVYLSDVAAEAGTGNALTWLGGGADGSQHLTLALGPEGEFLWDFAADGSTSFPGTLELTGDLGGADPPVGISRKHNALVLAALGAGGESVVLTDTLAFNGSGNGIYFFAASADGDQFAQIFTGPEADFAWTFAADGSTSFPGPITVAGDETFDANTHGPVIHDQSDGHTYRIVCTMGILSTVQVS